MKRTKFLAFTFALILTFACLFQLGILNPWRISRKVSTLLKRREQTDIDVIESNLSNITAVEVSALCIGNEEHLNAPFYQDLSLNPEESRQIIDILRHMGPINFDSQELADPPFSMNITIDHPYSAYIRKGKSVKTNELFLQIYYSSTHERKAIQEILSRRYKDILFGDAPSLNRR
jgi:hypothetical protein